ncbi:MAG TPA: FHA domain-containing protein [Thermoanaerobaculia bacterium]|nr:FHA domain-containing protein [Thermoanaerobaculia bacterium]
MMVALIVAGVLFLLLAFVLFIVAIVAFFMSRNRSNAAVAPPPYVPQPTPAPRVAQPVSVPASPVNAAAPMQPMPAVPAQPAPAAPVQPMAGSYLPPSHVDDDKTVMTDQRRGQLFGALHGTSGPLAGRVFPIDASGFYIGRDRSTSQVVIDSPSISKRHLWIGLKEGVVVAIDQGSTNGTFLNDPNAAITEARLTPGDTLILGGDVARFEYRL